MKLESKLDWKGNKVILAGHNTAGKSALEMALIFQKDAKLLCAVDKGPLRQSIQIANNKQVIGSQKGGKIPMISLPKKDGEYHSGTAMPYAGYVEYGTGPHRTGDKSDQFLDSIKEWCHKKGIENVWGVIRSIRKHGTRPQPFIRPAWDRLHGQSIEFVKNKVQGYWEQQVKK